VQEVRRCYQCVHAAIPARQAEGETMIETKENLTAAERQELSSLRGQVLSGMIETDFRRYVELIQKERGAEAE
jgi:hypothetical protein